MPDMKLLLISNLFPNPKEPLRGIFVYNIAQELRKKCKLVVISPLPWVPIFLRKRGKYRKFALVPKEFEIEGIKVFSPKYLALPKLGVIHPFFMAFSILPLLRRLKKQNKIDVVNTHCIYPDGVAVSLLSRFMKLPLVLSALGTDINCYSKYRIRRMEIKKALQWSDKITTVSEALKEVILRLGIKENKISVIRNGVDSANYKAKEKDKCRKTLEMNNYAKIILFVGRLVEVKGLNYLIEAMGLINQENEKDTILYIIGEGDDLKYYQQKVTKLKLDDCVLFVGTKSRKEMPTWYGACDLLCLPSIEEGCPNVILEALASGRPVVASKVGGVPELINKKNGVLFNRGDILGLRVALNTALETKWDRDEIINTIKGYTWEKVADRFLNLYNKIFLNRSDIVPQ